MHMEYLDSESGLIFQWESRTQIKVGRPWEDRLDGVLLRVSGPISGHTTSVSMTTRLERSPFPRSMKHSKHGALNGWRT